MSRVVIAGRNVSMGRQRNGGFSQLRASSGRSDLYSDAGGGPAGYHETGYEDYCLTALSP